MRLSSRDDAGVASILVVLCSVILLGVTGISIDVGRAVAVTRSAQNSADAVALAMGKDCVELGGLSAAGYDRYIRTGPAIGDGQTQSLTAGSCATGFVTATARETMAYTFSKVFGASDTLRARSATARWGQLASGVIFPFTFSNCAFPDSFTVGNPTTAGSRMMLYAQGVRTSCPRDGSAAGQTSNSKGFVAGGCQLTSIGGTLTDANGNSFIGTNCISSDLSFYVGKDVLLPVWGAASGNPSQYAITTLVGFHVLGWSGNGNDRGGAMSGRCQASDGFTGAIVGDNTKPCLYGYVTSFTSTSGGTTGVPCSAGPLGGACFVYLEP